MRREDTVEKKKAKIFYGYVIVIVSFFIYILGLGTLSTYGVFFKPISTEFGWTRTITSGAHSLCFFLYGILGFVAGRLSDKFGPRLVLTVCGFLLGLGYLLMSQISTVWQLYLFYGVMVGMGVAGNYTPLASTIPKWFVKRRGMMMAIASAGFGLGIMIMPRIATQLISTYGWRTSYVVIGTIVLLLITSGAQLLRRSPEQVGEFPDGERVARANRGNIEAVEFSLREAIHTGQLWILSVIWMCHGVWTTAIVVHIVPYATDQGFSPANAANILVIVGGLHIIGRITMGSVSDKIGSKSSFIISILIVTTSLLWLQFAKELWMLYLFAAIFGFGNYGMAAVMPLVATELFGISSLGAILGIVAILFGIGALIGPILAGRIFDTTSSYQLAFSVFTSVTILAFILALFLTPPRKQEGMNNSRGTG